VIARPSSPYILARTVIIVVCGRLVMHEGTLRGRSRECAQIDALVQNASRGTGGSLIFRGEAGIGKTALLDYAAGVRTGFRVARIGGVESEVELPYAALHQLCGKMLHLADRLPAPQADALDIALGQKSGEVPDRFHVSLAVLGLLSEAAREQPMLCLVDDAQWIDQPSLFALAFAARRVDADSLALVFTTRESISSMTGIYEVTVGGLPDAEARELLASVVPGRLDERVRDQIIAETRGNPLALLELPHGLNTEELAGGFGFPKPAALSSRLEEGFLRRARGLPQPTQLLLLLAAAEPLGDPGLLRRAGRDLGITEGHAAPAEAEGLFQVRARATFRHPLVRSAIYRAATEDERHRVHRALAAATDADADADRRVWHRAHATSGPDDALADELERSASRAQARGGPSAAAVFLERAAALASDRVRRATLIISSAELHYDAGSYRAAGDLLAGVNVHPLADFHQVRAERLQSRLLLGTQGSSAASRQLMQAARRFEPHDIEVACDTYLDAFVAASTVGASSVGDTWMELAQSIRALPSLAESGRATDVLLAGLAMQAADGYAAGIPLLRRALRMMLDDPKSVRERSDRDQVGLLWFGCRVAANIWDQELLFQLANRMLGSARASASVTLRASIASDATHVALLKGDLSLARTLSDETLVMRTAAGSPPWFMRQGPLALAAWQGHAHAFEGLRTASPTVDGTDQAMWSAIAHCTAAILYNGLGRYEEALAEARQGSEHAADLSWAMWCLPELVEGAARSGKPDVAAAALEQLRRTTGPAATDWGLGIQARCQAVMSEGDVADEEFREAVERLGRAGIAAHLGRAHLLYGEWLRRENRRIDAREQLRTARELFLAIGAGAFTTRAERELQATGEKIRKRASDTRAQLTAQERQVAELARDGCSNGEIGAQLFISPRTVEYHLHKVFAKLGITSRTKLNRALEMAATAP
jgi:DNA-binding CsgD family transcriptional regulator